MPSLPSATRSGVFVSYSRKDGEAFARNLRAEIKGRNIPVWHDRSSMEGGRDWWEQIKEALNHVEYMVLVMTPAAMESGIVRKEWRFARQQGVCVYPIIAQAGIDISSLPRWMSSVHWYDLEHQQDKFYNDLNTRCQVRRVPFMAPDQPADFVPRDVQFDQLKASLLSPDKEEPVAITAALRGAGGYGKTTLASALCHDDDIQNAYDDGVLWVTLGEHPTTADLLGKLGDLIETLAAQRPNFEGLDAASARFSELLADRDILLVIDDVWRSSDLRPFLNGGRRCARLVTTRRADTLPAQSLKVPVDQMTSAEAVMLLSNGLPAGFKETFRALAARLGEWPLLLKLANAWLRKRINDSHQPPQQAFEAFNLALNKRGVTAFDAQNAGERNDAAAKTLEISFADLSPNDQIRLLELAVFKEDLNIPLQVLEVYWQHTGQLDVLDVEETCQRLFDSSLLLDFSLADRHIRLHDAIRTWLIGRPGGLSMTERHAQLLACYRTPDTPWYLLPDDGYLYEHLAYHLAGAGQQEELENVLLNFNWIQARLSGARRDASRSEVIDVYGLLADYDLAPKSLDASLVKRALQMSSHVIGKWPEQAGFQLYGRLATSDSLAIQRLCAQAMGQTEGVAMVPLRPALGNPGSIVLTLVGHGDLIFGATLLADSRLVLSWSMDCTLKLWDLERGELLHTLAGHGGWVSGATLLADGRRALSWSDDFTLKLWDLERGELLHTLAGHEDLVNGATLLADGRRALSWSYDRTLKVWDLERGELLHTLAGHKDKVYGAMLLADGQRALSWSADRTLKLWDLERGELLHTLGGHEGEVYGAILLADGRRALSWAVDRTLQYWDLVSGSRVGIYVADASISTVLAGIQESRIFAGDALGYIHCISLKPVDSA